MLDGRMRVLALAATVGGLALLAFGATGAQAAKVSAGGNHSCAVKANDKITCWGSDQYGQSSPPGGKFRSVSAGYDHTCGVKLNGKASCWGYGDYGETDVPGADFKSIVAGYYVTCGIRKSGAADCFGYEGYDVDQESGGKFLSLHTGPYSEHACGVRPAARSHAGAMTRTGRRTRPAASTGR